MKKDFTEYYKFRTLCAKVANETEPIAEASEIDQRVEDVVISGIKSFRESYDTLFEFITLPHIAPLFDRWIKEGCK